MSCRLRTFLDGMHLTFFLLSRTSHRKIDIHRHFLHKRMRLLLLSTYLFGFMVACTLNVSESYGNEDFPEIGYLVEYEDGSFEFIPHGQTVAQLATRDEADEVTAAITAVASGTTSFLTHATASDLQRKSLSLERSSKCNMRLSERDDKGRGRSRGEECHKRRLMRGLRGSKKE